MNCIHYKHKVTTIIVGNLYSTNKKKYMIGVPWDLIDPRRVNFSLMAHVRRNNAVCENFDVQEQSILYFNVRAQNNIQLSICLSND